MGWQWEPREVIGDSSKCVVATPITVAWTRTSQFVEVGQETVLCEENGICTSPDWIQKQAIFFW